jgi:hypothetical protein
MHSCAAPQSVSDEQAGPAGVAAAFAARDEAPLRSAAGASRLAWE